MALPLTREYLIDLLTQAHAKLGRLPTRREMFSHFGVTYKPFAREFHSWDEAKQYWEANHKAGASDELVIDSRYDEDHLFGPMIQAEQAQIEVDEVLSKYGEYAKILSLSDIELPYANVPLINKAIAHAKQEGARICVLNGDITHSDFFSKHAKTAYIDPKEEYRQLEQLIAHVSRQFDVVLLVRGNHDDMVERWCNRHFDLSTVDFLVRHDLLANVAERYHNVYYYHNWWGRAFDIVYAHPSNYSVVPMRTATMAAESIKRFADFRALIIGHTHKVGQLISGAGPYVVEQGCACLLQPYQFKRPVKTTWWSAYNIAEVINGAVNYDGIKNHVLGIMKGLNSNEQGSRRIESDGRIDL